MTNFDASRLDHLLEATRDLRNALDLGSFLRLITGAAQELIRSEGASILVCNEGGNTLRFVAAPAPQWDAMRPSDVPVDGSIAGRVFRSGKPEIIRSVQGEGQHFKEIDRLTGMQTRSMVVLPLIFKGQKLGVMEVINRLDNSDYTEQDVAILEILGAQAATLLHNSLLEEKLQQALEEIAQLDRMKSDFIAIASHELRTPLGLILGHSALLRDLIDDPSNQEQLDVVIRAAGKLKGIIDDLSNVNSYQTGAAGLRGRLVSIRHIVLDVVEDYLEEAKQKNINLRAGVGSTDLMVEGDAEKIDIAVSNLVKNAITFTNPGGTIYVSAEQVRGYVKLLVIDNGIGIPAKDLSRIFERFYQVESHLTRQHGGMGLGLSVAKVMVELHGGRIWAESVEGKGSSFTVLLPIDPSQARATGDLFIS
jgi:signal transduction histidine kinase